MKVALIIIYNHKYDKNIDVIEQIYKEKFSHIYHLVPFYEGTRSNVIAVYENSFCFQGYVAQGLQQYFKDDYDHYFFVADDMILNPKINEHNYDQYLKLNKETSFIPRFIQINKSCPWFRVRNAYNFALSKTGIEVANELPSFEKAANKFKKFNLGLAPLSFDQLYDKQRMPRRLYRISQVLIFCKWYIARQKNKNRDYPLPYPLVGSYADIFVVSAKTIKKFSHYCGVFAALNLFVEIAIPTALVLASEEIVTEKDLSLQGKAYWPEDWQDIGGEDIHKKGDGLTDLKKFDNQLSALILNFPCRHLYVHPIKLSKWNVEL